MAGRATPAGRLKFYLAQTIVLRCLGQRHLNYALPKRSRTDAVRLDSGALPFTGSKNSIHPAGPKPARQWLPYQGSCRAEGETERFFPETALYEEAGNANALTERFLCINPAQPGHPRRVSGIFHRKKSSGLGVLHKICAGTQKEENKKEKTDFF